MAQKFRHLNCFFTCGMIASTLPRFCSVVLTNPGEIDAPRTRASLVRAIRSLIAFASAQLLDFTISEYGPVREYVDDKPYQKLACTRTCLRGPTVSAGVRGATTCRHGGTAQAGSGDRKSTR